MITMNSTTAIDLYPIKCYCGNSEFFVDSENLELVCSRCSRRIHIDSIRVENSYIEICVKDTCVLLLPTSPTLVTIMNELAYYSASPSTSPYSINTTTSTRNSIRNRNRIIEEGEYAVNASFASFLIISLYLFFIFILLFHLLFHIIPFDVVAMVFLVVVVLSFFLSLFS